MEAAVKLKKSSIAPRKMRLVADLIRGLSTTKAFGLLKHEPKNCAIHLEKLLLAAIASWQNKNPQLELAPADLHIKTIQVDSAGMLKRIKPAPQGRAYRIRKRSSHVTLVVDSRDSTDTDNYTPANRHTTPKTKLLTHGTKS